MLGFFDRQRLIKKGLSTSKKRRRRSSRELWQAVETGLGPKLAIFAAFILGLGLLFFYGTLQQPAEKFLIGLLIFITAIAQLWINHPETFAKNSRVLLMFSVFLLHLGIIKGLLLIGRAENNVPLSLAILCIPYAFAPLILSVLLGKNHGIYAAIFVSLWGSIVFREVDPAVFLVMSLICGFIAVFITLQVRRRSRLLRAGLWVGLATWVLALTFRLIGPFNPEVFGGTNWSDILWQSLAAIGSGIFTAVLVSGALPFLESLFNITTDISWLEAADLNHPLLKRMTIEAPGTYHHSLVVANLAEAGAEAIDANPTMCRVCSYFHDIGKLVKPDYFTENMNLDRNPHDDLAPTMSALIIIAHVKEGVDLALKHGLNQQVIDVIQQHHGTSLVQYFYRRAIQQRDDAREGGKIMNLREEDIPEVREESFRYGGPKPQTREAAIISLADSVESASRSLEKPTPQKIDQLIKDIIQSRLIDRQLDECPLNLKELTKISETFKFTMRSMLHSRIAYPAENKGAPREPATRRPPEAPPISAA